MDHSKFNNLIQIATSIAVLIGLALVVYELNQTKNLVMTQLTSDGFISGIQSDMAVVGENPAKALAKACMEPEKLTAEDIILLDRLYAARITQVQRVKALQEMAEFGMTWEDLATSLLPYILSNDYGRMWWDNVGSQYTDSELAQLGNKFRYETALPNCKQLVTDSISTLRNRVDRE